MPKKQLNTKRAPTLSITVKKRQLEEARPRRNYNLFMEQQMKEDRADRQQQGETEEEAGDRGRGEDRGRGQRKGQTEQESGRGPRAGEQGEEKTLVYRGLDGRKKWRCPHNGCGKLENDEWKLRRHLHHCHGMEVEEKEKQQYKRKHRTRDTCPHCRLIMYKDNLKRHIQNSCPAKSPR